MKVHSLQGVECGPTGRLLIGWTQAECITASPAVYILPSAVHSPSSCSPPSETETHILCWPISHYQLQTFPGTVEARLEFPATISEPLVLSVFQLTKYFHPQCLIRSPPKPSEDIAEAQRVDKWLTWKNSISSWLKFESKFLTPSPSALSWAQFILIGTIAFCIKSTSRVQGPLVSSLFYWAKDSSYPSDPNV